MAVHSPFLPASAGARAARGLLAALLFLLCSALPPSAPAPERVRRADAAEPGEYEVKAYLLGHFFSYTTWPESAFESETAPIRLLVVGKDPFGKLLEITLGRKTVGKRAIVVERVDGLPRKLTVHAVFCGGLAPEQRLALIRLAAGRPVLLVGETPGFAEDGAGVNLFIERTKVRFEVNPEALKGAGLSLSSEMLKLARLVRTRSAR